MIKVVYQHEKELSIEGKRKLHVVDEKAMKDAEKMIYEEFAYVFQIEKTEVLPFIIQQIEGIH